ncbi:MAG: von Willebrand factor type A domain-containing protein [Alphaproteobacteria bacterium]|nr:von Willebrand factor type A domain-containing protein [Alphaproteobacteria bacterium]
MPQDARPSSSRLPVLLGGSVALFALAGFVAAGTLSFVQDPEPQSVVLEGLPDRFVVLEPARARGKHDGDGAASTKTSFPPEAAAPRVVELSGAPTPSKQEALAREGASAPAERRAEKEREVIAKQKLLMALIGTRGEGEGGSAENLFSDGDVEYSLDRALSSVSGADTSGGKRGKLDMGEVQLEGLRRAPRADAAPGTERYTDYGVNDMTLTEVDRHSTFSVDVDTASWSIARRKLREGWLPPTASVRVEEFVNAQTYSYTPPGPADGAPFAVHAEGAPSPFEPGRHLLRIGLAGLDELPGGRAPANLTFLVDVSGSMSSRIGQVKRSLHTLVDNLGPEDTVAIATYAGSSQVVLEPTSALRAQELHAAIDGLRIGGGTHMDSGMQLAYDMALEGFIDGGENRVIVLSDGDANIGRTSHEQILEGIRGYADQGVTLSTIGFGVGNYKDTLMEQLADKGDGEYHYVDSDQAAERLFGESFTGRLQTIARDVKIQVEFNPEAVMAYRLVGYENRDIADQDFRVDAVDAGEIRLGHQVTALYELVLRDRPRGELATVRVRAKPPGPDAPAQEWSTRVTRGQLRAEWADGSSDLQVAVATAVFAEKLRGSPYAEEITWDAIVRMAEDAQRSGVEEDAERVELVRRAAELAGEGKEAERYAGTVVEQVLQRNRGQAMYCYERVLHEDETLEGRVEVEMELLGGRVMSTMAIYNSTGSEALAECVEAKIRRWRFPADVEGSVTAPFTFTPDR